MKNKGNLYLFYSCICLIEILSFRMASTIENALMSKILIVSVILFNSLFLAIVLTKNKFKETKAIYRVIFLSYIIRTIIMFLDLFGYTHGFTGADTERFYKYAINNIPTTVNYIHFLKCFFKIIGNSRIVAQYFNVLLSLFSICILYKILQLIETNRKAMLIVLCIFAFAPANILLSAALLREPLMIFLNTTSLYMFIKWYKKGKLLDFIFSLICAFLSAWLHSGMIAVIVLYCIALPFYKRNTDKLIIKKNSLFMIIVITIIIMGILSFFGNSVLAYFNRIKDVEDITARNAIGNTDYLKFLNNTSSLTVLILFTPLKIIYFYFSPMPWDCKSLNIVSVFLFSSTIYIYIVNKIIWCKSQKKTLKLLLLIALISLSIVYSLGVSNAGTAMRHREKMIPYLLVLCALSEKKKRDEFNENNV